MIRGQVLSVQHSSRLAKNSFSSPERQVSFHQRCASRPQRDLKIYSRRGGDFGRREKDNVRFWNEEQRFLKKKWKEQGVQSFGLPGIGTLVLGFIIASTLGPLVLAFVLGFAGLAFSAVMGFTALTVFLPVVLVGSLVTSVLFGAIQLAFAVPVVGAGFLAYTWARRAIKKGVQAEVPEMRQERDQKEHQWQLEDRESERLSKQELFDFDKRLEKRTDPNAL